MLKIAIDKGKLSESQFERLFTLSELDRKNVIEQEKLELSVSDKLDLVVCKDLEMRKLFQNNTTVVTKVRSELKGKIKELIRLKNELLEFIEESNVVMLKEWDQMKLT